MWTAVVIGAFVAPSIVASQPFEHRPKERFTLIESGGGLGVDVENTTVFLAVDRGGRATWFVERNSNETNSCGRTSNGQCISTDTSSLEWIDGRSCGPLRDVLMHLGRARKEERGSARSFVSDTPLLSLVMFERGQMATERLSEYTGPLVDWWHTSQEQLKSCWTKARPRDL